jgi:membrane protease YdiL (CAAX protease family)
LKTRIKQIFAGSQGVREVWRLLSYAALLVGSSFILVKGTTFALRAAHVHFPHAPGQSPVEELVLGQLVTLCAAFIATRLMAAMEGRRLTDFGLAQLDRRSSGDFGAGVLWGMALIASLIGLLSLKGAYSVSAVALTGSPLVRYTFLWACAAAVNGFAENLAVFGYPLTVLKRWMGFWPAALVLCALFTLGHLENGGENWMGLGSIFLQAFVLLLSVWLGGTLWLSIGLHAGGIFAEDFVFSLPDSGVDFTGHLLAASLKGPVWLTGGSAGPEGSVLALPVIAGAVVALLAVYRTRVRRLRNRSVAAFDASGRRPS